MIYGNCHYSYTPTLKGNITFLGGVYDSQGSFRFEDVQQGAIGDCGLGASVLALLGSNRWEALIAGQYDLRTAGENGYFDVEFANPDGSPWITQIDDVLPFSADTPSGCWPYLGYQPTKDASGNTVLYMPLLEKAWAKYLDANPTLKTHQLTGYDGLGGTDPATVLRALTGWQANSTGRSGSGVNPTMRTSMLDAIKNYQPTVFATPTSDSIKTLGYSYDNSTATASLTYGTLTVTEPNHYLKYTRYSDGSSHFIVGGHAYALTPDDDLRDQTSEDEMGKHTAVLRNPWGANPSSETEANGPQEFAVLSIDEILTIVTEMYTVTPPASEDPRNP